METSDLGAGARTSAPSMLIDRTQAGQVFISYARVNARRADDVEQALTAWGFRAWMDRQQLGGGGNWTVELERALDESVALVLILTPLALRSQMVRREYMRALERGIPVVIAMYRPVRALPQELAQAPLIDMRKRLPAMADFYLALTERGVNPATPTGELDLMSVAAFAPVTLPVLGGRTPSGWRVFHAPIWSYWLRILGRIAPMLLYEGAKTFIPAAWWARPLLQQTHYWLFNALEPVFLLIALYYAIPALNYLIVLMGIAPREMVVLTADSCVTSLFQVRRVIAIASVHRYQYRWAASAKVHRSRWGGVIVAFMGIAGTHAAFRLPWYWSARDTIARSIVADVAAFPREPTTEIHATSNVSASIVAHSPAPVAMTGPQWYALLAPAAENGLVANVQSWLGTRGMWPVEMVWSRERNSVLAPTERGAAYCRFALFVDTPVITQDSRWRAILADLQRRGVTLIPLRTEAKQPSPSAWSALQWIDFSKGVARDRSILSLCDTLDLHGLLPMPTLAANQPFLDTDLALARATYQRLPHGWTTFAGELVFHSTRLRMLRRSALYVTLMAGFSAAVFVTMASLFRLISISQEVAVELIVVGALFVGAIAYQSYSRSRASAERVRDQTVQERLIIAPEGLAFHFLNRLDSEMARRMLLRRIFPVLPEREILHGSVLFEHLHAIERRNDWLGARTLRLVMRDGRVIMLPLLTLGASAELAIEQAQEAFRAYWASRAIADRSARLADQ